GYRSGQHPSALTRSFRKPQASPFPKLSYETSSSGRSRSSEHFCFCIPHSSSPLCPRKFRGSIFFPTEHNSAAAHPHATHTPTCLQAVWLQKVAVGGKQADHHTRLPAR
ncbi:unnamed protein product, partial [Laminaria digitata]